MKRLVMAVVLACALSSTVLAGHIPNTDVAAPIPPPSPLMTDTAIAGHVPTCDAATPNPMIAAMLAIVGLVV